MRMGRLTAVVSTDGVVIEVLLYHILVTVRDGDVLASNKDAESDHGLGLAHVDDIGTVGAHELGLGQILFN